MYAVRDNCASVASADRTPVPGSRAEKRSFPGRSADAGPARFEALRRRIVAREAAEALRQEPAYQRHSTAPPATTSTTPACGSEVDRSCCEGGASPGEATASDNYSRTLLPDETQPPRKRLRGKQSVRCGDLHFEKWHQRDSHFENMCTGVEQLEPEQGDTEPAPQNLRMEHSRVERSANELSRIVENGNDSGEACRQLPAIRRPPAPKLLPAPFEAKKFSVTANTGVLHPAEAAPSASFDAVAGVAPEMGRAPSTVEQKVLPRLVACGGSLAPAAGRKRVFDAEGSPAAVAKRSVSGKSACSPAGVG